MTNPTIWPPPPPPLELILSNFFLIYSGIFLLLLLYRYIIKSIAMFISPDQVKMSNAFVFISAYILGILIPMIRSFASGRFDELIVFPILTFIFIALPQLLLLKLYDRFFAKKRYRKIFFLWFIIILMISAFLIWIKYQGGNYLMI